MTNSPEIRVNVPDLKSELSPNGGMRISASNAVRSFQAVLRRMPGEMIYTTDEFGVRQSKGWVAVDTIEDIERATAELLLWTATAKVGEVAARISKVAHLRRGGLLAALDEV